MMNEYDFSGNGSAIDNGGYNFSGNGSALATKSDQGWYDTSNIDIDTFSSFTPSSDTDWWAYISDLANTKLGSGIIQGAATGAMTMYSQNQANEQSEKNTDKSLAFQREKLLAEQAIAEGQLALEQAALDDKINTRARHNASIARKPAAAKKVKFG